MVKTSSEMVFTCSEVVFILLKVVKTRSEIVLIIQKIEKTCSEMVFTRPEEVLIS